MRVGKILGALVLCTSQIAIAHAQTADDQAAANDQSAGEEITVTGSRIVRDGSQAPTPVTAVTSEALTQSAPSNIADALNKLPQFTGSSSQNSGQTFNAGSTPLGNYLNMRALGSQRMLVLLNGQRVPPTINTNAVDVNVLPQMLVSRVDVVTGGVSAVYGSDAVTGVVNYVLDDRFKGLKLSGQAGISNYGDDFSYKYGLAFGTNLGDRIHVIGSYEHYSSKGLDSLFDRDWANYSGVLLGAGTTANPLGVTFNARRNNLASGGAMLGGALANTQFRPDGSLAPFVVGTPTNSTLYNVGGDGGVWGINESTGATSIAGSLNTHQAFARATIDIGDNTQFYTQGIYATSRTGFNTPPNNHAYGAAGGNRRITIFADNPYLRPEVVALLNGAGQTSFDIGRIFTDVPLPTQRSKTEFVSAQAGLKGEIGGNWKWDVNYVYGRSKLNVAFDEWGSRELFAALDAVRNPSGQIVCRVNLTSTVLPGCTPINIFGTGNITRDGFDWARRDSTYGVVNKMQYLNANIQGDLFTLPAGSVVLAVGAEWREQKLTQTSNSDPAAFSGTGGPAARAAYFAGIRGVPTNALISTSINVGTGQGTQTVKEVYGELSIPLLKDVAFAQNLDLDLAARLTDYKTSGSVTTWKASGNWEPVDGLRFRVSRSRDIAAPSLFDLYGGANVVASGVTDPLTGQAVTVLVSTAGNPVLKPEFGDTTTIGFVAQPRAIPGLTLSVDAYRINIKGAIRTQSAVAQLADCHASGGSAPVCALIVRPFPYSNSTAANVPTLINVVPQNLANLKTQGIDFELSYTTSLDKLLPSIGGNLSLRAFAGYLDKYSTQDTALLPVINLAGRSLASQADVGLPKWKGMLSQTYSNERLSFTLSERFTGSYVYGSPTQVFASPIKAPNKTYVDLNLSYDLMADNRFEAFLNVQNLFNVAPPVLNTTLATNLAVPTDKATYDVIGRYFTLGFRAKF